MPAYLKNETKLFLIILLNMALLIGSYILLMPYGVLGLTMLIVIAISVVATMLVGIFIGGILAVGGVIGIGGWLIWQSTSIIGQNWLATQSFSMVVLLLFVGSLMVNLSVAGYLQQQLSKLAKRNEQMQEQVEDLVAVDLTTQFDNDRRMHMDIAREIKRVHRHGSCFTLLFLSFDHYKEFLKAYGEKEMNHLLVTLSKNVNDTLRTTDYKYRFNQHKFAFLLVETPQRDVEVVIEKLHEQLKEHTLLSEKKVTLSFHISFEEYNQQSTVTADEFISQLERETVFYAI